LALDTSGLKTFRAPATPGLIAYAVIGGTITVEISLSSLDGPDQFCFEHVVGLNAMRSGNAPDFHDFHGSSPCLLP
jgi:hypothetical protein